MGWRPSDKHLWRQVNYFSPAWCKMKIPMQSRFNPCPFFEQGYCNFPDKPVLFGCGLSGLCPGKLFCHQTRHTPPPPHFLKHMEGPPSRQAVRECKICRF
jgi:hypothetical protein